MEVSVITVVKELPILQSLCSKKPCGESIIIKKKTLEAEREEVGCEKGGGVRGSVGAIYSVAYLHLT
jgi:hypothetical protein